VSEQVDTISNSGTERVPLVGVWVSAQFLEPSAMFQKEEPSTTLALTATCEGPLVVLATSSAQLEPHTRETEIQWSLRWAACALPAQLQHLWLQISWLSARKQLFSPVEYEYPIASCQLHLRPQSLIVPIIHIHVQGIMHVKVCTFEWDNEDIR
jgi:hypothetical protein